MPFIAAVSLDGGGDPRHVKLTIVAGVTSLAIAAWAKTHLAAVRKRPQRRTCVLCRRCRGPGCLHGATIVGRLKPKNELPQFRWINTVLGNLKTTFAGSYHALDYRTYAQRYLSAFGYRFNRRFYLRGLVRSRLIRETTVAIKTQN